MKPLSVIAGLCLLAAAGWGFNAGLNAALDKAFKDWVL